MFRIGFLILLLGFTSASQTTNTEEAKPKTIVKSIYDGFTIRSTSRARSLNIRMKLIFPTYEPTGVFPYDTGTPLPVVIFMGGWFVESNRYQWLGERLARECKVVWVISDTLVATNTDAVLTSIGGSVFDAWNPTHGLMTLLKKLKTINSEGVLAGRLDLDNILLGGHSWGGRVILVADSSRGGLPTNVKGVFVYAAHTERAWYPGFMPGSMIKLRGWSPLLLMAANRDEIMQSRFPSASRSAVQAMKRTFDYSVSKDRKCYFVEFDGFNHMSSVYPEDDTIRTARADGKSTHDKATMMEEIYLVISLFVRENAHGDQKAAGQLEKHLFGKRNKCIKDAARKG